MALKRRKFLGLIATRVSAALAPGLWLARHACPRRVVEAMRSRVYPGPLKRLDRNEIDRPGRWLG
jgi:hypothetical protein